MHARAAQEFRLVKDNKIPTATGRHRRTRFVGMENMRRLAWNLCEKERRKGPAQKARHGNRADYNPSDPCLTSAGGNLPVANFTAEGRV